MAPAAATEPLPSCPRPPGAWVPHSKSPSPLGKASHTLFCPDPSCRALLGSGLQTWCPGGVHAPYIQGNPRLPGLQTQHQPLSQTLFTGHGLWLIWGLFVGPGGVLSPHSVTGHPRGTNPQVPLTMSPHTSMGVSFSPSLPCGPLSSTRPGPARPVDASLLPTLPASCTRWEAPTAGLQGTPRPSLGSSPLISPETGLWASMSSPGQRKGTWRLAPRPQLGPDLRASGCSSS